MTFEEWQATGRDVTADHLAHFGDFDGAAGREYDGGYLVQSGDQWAIYIERDCTLLASLPEAEAYLWAAWSAGELTGTTPPHHIVTAPDGTRRAILIDLDHDTSDGSDALDTFCERTPALANLSASYWAGADADRPQAERDDDCTFTDWFRQHAPGGWSLETCGAEE